MTLALATTTKWLVSTRSDGEVLTAGVGSDGLEFAIAGFPERFTPEEVGGWLFDLTGVARETQDRDESGRTIPPLLHHALTGLLFSHAELWENDGVSRPCSAAFLHDGGRVGFGWVGEAVSEVWVDDGPLLDVYTRVRDDAGREALGIAFPATSRVRVRLTWSALPGAMDAPAAIIEAVWAGLVPDAESDPSRALEMDAALAIATAGMSLASEPDAENDSIVPGMASAPLAELAETAAVAGPVGTEAVTPMSMPESLPPVEAATAGVSSLSLESSEVAPGVEHAEMDAVAAATLCRPRRRGFLSRLTGWFRAKPVSDDTTEEPAAVTPAESEALSIGAPGTASSPAEATPAMEPLFTETPAPPALAIRAPEVMDPHERVLGPPSLSTAPVLHVAPPVEAGREGPPVLRIPRLSEAFASAPSVAPLEPATPVGSEPPAPWEPPPSIIVDPDRPMSSDEEALAAALAALAADTHEPAPPEAMTFPAAPAGTAVVESPSLGTSSAMRAALTARTVARASSATAIESPVAAGTMSGTAASEAGPEVSDPVAPPPLAERIVLVPEWPSDEQIRASVPLWRRPWAWGVLVAALFLGGWIVGGMQDDRAHVTTAGPLARIAQRLGLGGARFDVLVTSRPPGAWIAVDGKDLARHTPASIDLSAGTHTVTLSLSDLGSASFPVRGQHGDRVTLDAPLSGSLDILAVDGSPPVSVIFDGRDAGYAPVHLDDVQPGAHDLRFSGPGTPAWGQPVEVRIGQRAQVIARPMSAPAAGIIEVRSSITDDEGTRALTGAAVFIDGVARGSTPLTLELPRGPHSVRVAYREREAPVQVIDLPGGNQRFADFELGVGSGGPRLTALEPPARLVTRRTSVLSAALDGVATSEAREMWLHVRTPEGAWRRYQMALMRSPNGMVGVAVFPTDLFDGGTRARWYASATISTGDEYFTEMAETEIVAPPR